MSCVSCGHRPHKDMSRPQRPEEVMENNNAEIPEALQEIFETLKQDIVWIHGRWKMYRQLFGTNELRVFLNKRVKSFIGRLVPPPSQNAVFGTVTWRTKPMISAIGQITKDRSLAHP